MSLLPPAPPKTTPEELKAIEDKRTREQRRKLWCDVLTSTASSTSCQALRVAVNWADKSVKAFDDRVREGKI